MKYAHVEIIAVQGPMAQPQITVCLAHPTWHLILGAQLSVCAIRWYFHLKDIYSHQFCLAKPAADYYTGNELGHTCFDCSLGEGTGGTILQKKE